MRTDAPEEMELIEAIGRAIGVPNVSVCRLRVTESHALYQIRVPEGGRFFVKCSKISLASSSAFLRYVAGSPLVANLVADPFRFRDADVQIMEWRDIRSKRIEEMTSSEFAEFIRGCSEYARLMSDAAANAPGMTLAPHQDPEAYMSVIKREVAGSVLARWLLRSVLGMRPDECRYPPDSELVVKNCDFRPANFGFDRITGRMVFLDYDVMAKAIDAESLANVFACSACRLRFPWLSRKGRRLERHFVACLRESGFSRSNWLVTLSVMRLCEAAFKLDGCRSPIRAALRIRRADRGLLWMMRLVDRELREKVRG